MTLPTPTTATEYYLAAIYQRQGEILEELRSQKADPQPAPEIVDLKEPRRPGRPRKEG